MDKKNLASTMRKLGKTTVSTNADRTLLVITEDKLLLLLHKFKEACESQHAWLTPLSLFASLLVTIISVDNFGTRFFVPSAVWEALVYLGLVVSGLWLSVSLYRLFRNRREWEIGLLVSRMKQIAEKQESISRGKRTATPWVEKV